MGRRTVLLLAAILVAAIGTGLVFLYVQGADQRARTNQTLIKAYRAKTLIAANTPADQILNKIESYDVPKGSQGGNWVANLSQLNGKVPSVDISPGATLLLDQFGEPGSGSASTAAAPIDIDKGNVALAVQVSDPGRVAGFLRPGSKVAVFLNREAYTAVLLPEARVITVGGVVTRPEASPVVAQEALPQSIVTLSVPTAKAAEVIFASTKGELYFTLLGPQATVPGDSRASVGDLPQ